MIKFLIAMVLGFGIGAFCRAADLPSPGPPFFQGAFLVCMMTVGFLTADYFKRSRSEEGAAK